MDQSAAFELARAYTPTRESHRTEGSRAAPAAPRVRRSGRCRVSGPKRPRAPGRLLSYRARREAAEALVLMPPSVGNPEESAKPR